MKQAKQKKPSQEAEASRISRREFAARASAAAAAIAANPGALLGAAGVATAATAAAEPQQPGANAPKLSPAAQAEVDAKVAEIFRRYGEKLSDEQKADIRRLVRDGQAPLEALRAFPLENSDEPATLLHLVGPSRRAASSSGSAGSPTAGGKKPAGGGA